MDGAIVQLAPDGTVTYRASALGSCTKALVAARLGYDPLPPPKVAEDLFREGHFHEQQVQERMAELGFPVERQEEEVKLQITGKVSVVGHIDGITQSPHNDNLVVEIKTQSPEAWTEFKRRGWESGYFPKYKWQTSVYMHALDMPLMLVRKNRSTGEIDTQIVETPYYTYADIRSQVLRIETGARIAGEPPDFCDQNDGFFCPYRYLHEVAEVADVEPLRGPEIDLLAREYQEAGAEEKAARGRREEARKKLRAGLTGDRHRTPSGVLVTFYKAKNPPQFNKVKAAEDGVDVEKYMEQSEGERLRVTLPKEKEEDDG